jgi:deoxyribonuclease-4
VAFCLDTAHLWGAGVDLADALAVDRVVRSFADEVGIDRLPLVHLNDTKSERGSRVDRHEHLGAGRIGPAGIAAILRHPLLAGATSIIETPGMDEGYDAINLARALALARGEPLAPLPPGALTLRGSRSRSLTPRPERDAAGRPARRTEPTPARTSDAS